MSVTGMDFIKMQKGNSSPSITVTVLVTICSLITAVPLWIVPEGHLGNIHYYSIFKGVSINISHNWQPLQNHQEIKKSLGVLDK